MKLTLARRVWTVTGLLASLIVLGTIGYMTIEGWSWGDALFMTVITISTVGYGEVQPLSEQGQALSIVLILLGVGGAAYTFSVLADYIVAGELRGVIRRQRMDSRIVKLQKHYIICGFGRVGQQVADGLRANGFDMVVIDIDAVHVDLLDSRGINYVIGDAANDDVLRQAGIERASGLCMCLPNDATNVFTILSAHTLNPNLYIIARSNLPESEHKLRMAGANQVINPYVITGHRMAAQLLYPGVIEFLDVIMRQGDLELRIGEILIAADSGLRDKTLDQNRIRTEVGANVLAVRKPDGRLFTHLGADFLLHSGDALISLGTAQQLKELAKRAGDSRKFLRLA